MNGITDYFITKLDVLSGLDKVPVCVAYEVDGRRLDEIPHDPQTRLWLYGVARRVLANHHRGERRRSALADRLRADLAVGYHPPEFEGEQAQITEAFRGLPAADRELLALSAWEGLGYGQIAVVLGCSRNAVRLRLFRARKRFAAELAGTRARSAQSDVPVPHGGFV